MQSSLLIAGFGGQGVMLMGQLLGYAACAAGKEATFLPSYGPEQRGGTANCTVIIADRPIGAPRVRQLDVLIALNEPSLAKFLPMVKPNGIVIANSSLVHSKVERDDVQVCYLPADDIARELGSARVANVVMLGAYISRSGTLTVEQMDGIIAEKLAKKAELLEINKTALRRGIEAAE
jgi:2-oxoglutarate ferredoxin oxidoreductase subunit gamma